MKYEDLAFKGENGFLTADKDEKEKIFEFPWKFIKKHRKQGDYSKEEQYYE